VAEPAPGDLARAWAWAMASAGTQHRHLHHYYVTVQREKANQSPPDQGLRVSGLDGVDTGSKAPGASRASPADRRPAFRVTLYRLRAGKRHPERWLQPPGQLCPGRRRERHAENGTPFPAPRGTAGDGHGAPPGELGDSV
jgi:hypothetical protein